MPAWIDLLNKLRVERRTCEHCVLDTQDSGCGAEPEHELCCPVGVAETAAELLPRGPDGLDGVRTDARNMALAFCDPEHPVAAHWRMVAEALATLIAETAVTV